MKKYLFNLLLIIPLIALLSCQSSQETTGEQKQPQPEVKEMPPPPPAEEKSSKIDTLDAKVENNTKVAYVPPPIAPPTQPTEQTTPVIKNIMGNFSVQLGAFEREENALQFAYAAKNKLNADIYNIFDKGLNLYRILIGSFDTKEAAHAFRSQLVDKNPEYKDAWVIDINKDLKR
jgi:cell division septation protein DedD